MTAPSSRVVRITHWVNAIALTIMIGSGLRIFNAYPAFARRGETFCCYPFEHTPIPAKLTFGGWLGGARNWHFAMMWVLVVERSRLPRVHLSARRVARPRAAARRRARLGRDGEILSRRCERIIRARASTTRCSAWRTSRMPLVGIMAVVTGIAIWKPVELAPLTDLLGGYVWARYWHFWAMLLLVVLTVGHVFMVFAVDPYSIPSMITGGYREDLSPEARNARPFVHLLPQHDSAPQILSRRTPRDVMRRRAGHAAERSASTAGAFCSPRRRRARRARARGVRLARTEVGAAPAQARRARRTRRSSARCSGTRRSTRRRPARCSAGGSFPSYFISKHVPVWDDVGARRVAARGRRHGEASRCSSRSPISRRCRASATSSITSASKGGRPSRRGPACACADIARLAGVAAGAQLRRLPVVRRRLPRELGHRERDASTNAHRVRAGRPLPQRRVGRAGARLLADEARIQEHEISDEDHFMPERNGGYWSDSGYEWYGGGT